MNKRETPQKVTMCDGCKKINPIWRHADRYNSSRFCVICGSYCSDYTFYENEIRRYEQEHEKYILSKRMKVIDLLNKIANGEEVPKKFTYKGYLWEYDIKNEMWFYYFGEGKIHRFDRLFYLNMCLNDEIKIIEEDKPIEELKIDSNFYETQNGMTKKDRKKLDDNFRNIDLILKYILDEIKKESDK